MLPEAEALPLTGRPQSEAERSNRWVPPFFDNLPRAMIYRLLDRLAERYSEKEH